RKERRDVDVEIEEIANDVGVLGPVQTMEDNRAWIDARRRLAIELGFEKVAQRLVVGERRTADIRRRHHARAELAHDPFPDVWMIACRREIEMFERKVRGLQPVVMAGDAVLVERRAVLLDGRLGAWDGNKNKRRRETANQDSHHRGE